MLHSLRTLSSFFPKIVLLILRDFCAEFSAAFITPYPYSPPAQKRLIIEPRVQHQPGMAARYTDMFAFTHTFEYSLQTDIRHYTDISIKLQIHEGIKIRQTF